MMRRNRPHNPISKTYSSTRNLHGIALPSTHLIVFAKIEKDWNSVHIIYQKRWRFRRGWTKKRYDNDLVMMLANNALRTIHIISFDSGGWWRGNARHFIYLWVIILCVHPSYYVLCKIGVLGDIDTILFGCALWCCEQSMQICLSANGNVVGNIRISLIGKWQYRIPSARFHSVANANAVLNPTGVVLSIARGCRR